VFGLLGPNGAGKTTTVEILEGLRTRSAGRVSVLDCDPEVQTLRLKDRVGVCLQSTRLPDKMKVREAMELFGALYTRTVDAAQLLKRLQLWEKREAFYTQLSGGQKQRLALALALLNDPQVLFLDEPSAGLDPQARLEIHELVQDLRREQRTILLTTHYIEEAEKLCDRVAIVDEGRIIALGTPRQIREKTLAHSTIEIECAEPLAETTLPEWENAISIWWTSTSAGPRSKRLSSSSPERACANEILLRTLQEQHAAHHAGPLGAVLQLPVPADFLLCVCGDVPCRHGAGHRVFRGHGADHGNPG
jgi:ABC-2 type transport system ATP-binding protein